MLFQHQFSYINFEFSTSIFLHHFFIKISEKNAQFYSTSIFLHQFRIFNINFPTSIFLFQHLCSYINCLVSTSMFLHQCLLFNINPSDSLCWSQHEFSASQHEFSVSQHQLFCFIVMVSTSISVSQQQCFYLRARASTSISVLESINSSTSLTCAIDLSFLLLCSSLSWYLTLFSSSRYCPTGGCGVRSAEMAPSHSKALPAGQNACRFCGRGRQTRNRMRVGKHQAAE